MSIYSRILENLQRLDELDYRGFTTKQRDITQLFPQYNQRVQAVNANGGIKLVMQLPEVWKFKVASGTKQGKSYDVFLRFKNLSQVLKEFIPNKQLWKKDGSGINLNLLAPEVFNKVDMELSCSCPATLYWGQNYIRTQKQAQFGPPENRAPNIKNPKQYGIACKHGGDVLERLPFYTSTFASWLKSFYSKEIDALVKEIKDKQEDIEAKEVEAGA
jgi:hypothetical protein